MQQTALASNTSTLKLEAAIEVLKKPIGVRTSDKIEKGQLILVPDTAKILALKPGDGVSQGRDNNLSVSIEPQPKFQTRVDLFLAPSVSNDVVCPAWFVEKTKDKALANMVWKPNTTNVVCVTTLPETAKAPAKHALKQDLASDVKVAIPILINVKALKAGERLLVFEDKKVEKRPPNVLSAGQAISKRIKSAKKK